MRRMFPVAAFALLMASSAFADSLPPNIYYVAHAPKNKDCTIVDVKPNGRTEVQVGRSYTSKTQAMTALKSSGACVQ